MHTNTRCIFSTIMSGMLGFSLSTLAIQSCILSQCISLKFSFVVKFSPNERWRYTPALSLLCTVKRVWTMNRCSQIFSSCNAYRHVKGLQKPEMHCDLDICFYFKTYLIVTFLFKKWSSNQNMLEVLYTWFMCYLVFLKAVVYPLVIFWCKYTASMYTNWQ